MLTRTRYHTLSLLALLGGATAADAQVQAQLAQRYFEEARRLCERDAGRLWGVSLCDPMVITLNAGWVVQPAARPGSFTIVREK